MSIKTREYGNWLASMKWDYNATIRRHYPLTEFNTSPMMDNLLKHRTINKLFYSIEQDREDNMTHVHLLLDTDTHYSRERLSKELSINKKAVSFLEEVKDVSDIGQYVTKDFWKRTSFYDIRFKWQSPKT